MLIEMESQMGKPSEDGSFLLGIWNMIRSLPGQQTLETLLKSFTFNIDSYSRTYDAHHAIARYDVIQRLPSIQCPTVALSGSYDIFIDDLEKVGKAIPECKTKVIEGAGVAICLEKPEEFAATILEFLSL
jgi:pimeloyl-ACP methyl ester carboxylesterase